MIIFNIFNNCIEAFLFSYFVNTFFDVKPYKLNILLSGLLQFFLLELGVFINDSGVWLTVCIILTNLIFLYFSKHELKFYYVFIILIFNFLILFSSIIGLVLENFILYYFANLSILLGQNVIGIILSKILLLIFTYITFHKNIKFKVFLDKEHWKIILIYLFLMILSIVYIGYTIVTDYDNYNVYIYIAILQVILFIIFGIVIYFFSKMNNERLSQLQMKQIKEFNKEKLSIIKNIRNEVEEIDHRLFYILFQVQYFLDNDEFDKAKKSLEIYRNQLTRTKDILITGNQVFDYIISLKINELVINGILVNVCISISQNIFFDDYNFINSITFLLSFFSEAKQIHIYIQQSNYFIIIRIISIADNLDIVFFEQFLNVFCNKYSGKYNIENYKLEGVRILLKIPE